MMGVGKIKTVGHGQETVGSKGQAKGNRLQTIAARLAVETSADKSAVGSFHIDEAIAVGGEVVTATGVEAPNRHEVVSILTEYIESAVQYETQQCTAVDNAQLVGIAVVSQSAVSLPGVVAAEAFATSAPSGYAPIGGYPYDAIRRFHHLADDVVGKRSPVATIFKGDHRTSVKST